MESREQLRELFAPIDFPVEALSFALAVTGYSEFHDFKFSASYEFFLDTLTESHVTATPDGYYVHRLHDRAYHGCSPIPQYLVDLTVSRDGQVSIVRRDLAFQDTANSGNCVN